MGRVVAVLQKFGIHTEGPPPLWRGNSIATSSHCSPQLDAEGCQLPDHPYPPTNTILGRLSPLWDSNVLEWHELLYSLPSGRIRVVSWQELTSRNPNLVKKTAAPKGAGLSPGPPNYRVPASQRGKRTSRSLTPNEYLVSPRWRAMLPQASELPQEPTPTHILEAMGLQPITTFCVKAGPGADTRATRSDSMPSPGRSYQSSAVHKRVRKRKGRCRSSPRAGPPMQCLNSAPGRKWRRSPPTERGALNPC